MDHIRYMHDDAEHATPEVLDEVSASNEHADLLNIIQPPDEVTVGMHNN